jgi:hypothetical protein
VLFLDGDDRSRHKVSMRGVLPNRDTFYPLAASASRSGCSRCGAAPGAFRSVPLHVGLTLAGFAWLIRRRNERKMG